MKQLLASMLGVAALAFVLNSGTARADDEKKEITVTGDAKCAACMLHEGETCKTVIQTKKGDKTVSYYVTDNDVSKNFHEDVCHGSKKVVAKGTVTEVDGKQKLTLTKIELAAK